MARIQDPVTFPDKHNDRRNLDLDGFNVARFVPGKILVQSRGALDPGRVPADFFL